MGLKKARNPGMQMRKAKAEARVKALKTGRRVVTLASIIDPKWLKAPLILDNVRIPESHLDIDAEDA